MRPNCLISFAVIVSSLVGCAPTVAPSPRVAAPSIDPTPTAPSVAMTTTSAPPGEPVSCAAGYPRTSYPARGDEPSSSATEPGRTVVELHYARRNGAGIRYVDWFHISEEDAAEVAGRNEVVLMRRGKGPWRVVDGTAGCPELPTMH